MRVVEGGPLSEVEGRLRSTSRRKRPSAPLRMLPQTSSGLASEQRCCPGVRGLEGPACPPDPRRMVRRDCV